MAQRGSWASYLIWGSIAVCAVLAASLTVALVVGAHRGIQLAGSAKRPAATAERTHTQAAMPGQTARPSAPAAGSPSAPSSASHDLARINDALRALAADRDRLAERLEQIEGAIGDITASTKRHAPMSSSRQSAIAPLASASDLAEVLRPYTTAQPLLNPPSPTQAPVQIRAASTHEASRAAESAAMRTEFAVDLGGGASMDSLRRLWTNLRGSHAGTLGNLQPLAAIRESSKAGSMELHLIAGPLANASAAAHTCAALQAKGVPCQTTIFDGQRLTLR